MSRLLIILSCLFLSVTVIADEPATEKQAVEQRAVEKPAVANKAQKDSEPAELSIRQKILMPGPLTASHAEYETTCESCHTAFTKEDLSGKCLDCHEEIAGDRKQQSGFHGQHPLASVNPCETCHTDHEGREFDIVKLQPDIFTHQHTRFVLEGKHAQLACNQCHDQGKSYREAETECVACHREDDVHKNALGDDCGSCHEPKLWTKPKPFDHSTTDFPLTGHHSEAPCASCHFQQKYEFSDTRCVSCHKASDVHAGGNGNDCAQCHQTSGWNNLIFNHDETEFPLRKRHAELQCVACHQPGSDRKQTPKACVSCHQNSDVHLGRHGRDCESCHDERSWKHVLFEHSRDAGFPLEGKHKDLSCTQCHSGNVHDSQPRDCAGCHAGDDVHHDDNMKLCGTCHSPTGWRNIVHFDHDLSHFPLVGMHQIVMCENCHIGNQFNATPSTCISCHSGDDVHKGSLGKECQQCHTPNAWQSWLFDHQTQTDYPLEGKHKGLGCNACHMPGTDPKTTPKQCGSCHRGQDIHNGEFGNHCENCHLPDSFFELLFQ